MSWSAEAVFCLTMGSFLVWQFRMARAVERIADALEKIAGGK